MKTKEEIQQLAEQDFNDRQECGHYELADLKSRDYYYDGFTNAYNQCQEDMAIEITELKMICKNIQNDFKALNDMLNSLNKQD